MNYHYDSLCMYLLFTINEVSGTIHSLLASGLWDPKRWMPIRIQREAFRQVGIRSCLPTITIVPMGMCRDEKKNTLGKKRPPIKVTLSNGLPFFRHFGGAGMYIYIYIY